jgi:hypothetical protein
MSFLIFDADRSLSTLGGPDAVKALCGGIPSIPVTEGFTSIRATFAKLFQKEKVKTVHPLAGEIEEEKITLNKAATELKLQGIVLDTYTHAARQEMRQIAGINQKTRQPNQMELQQWGMFGTRNDVLLSLLKELPTWVICNVHLDYDKDGTTGQMMFMPQIGGSTKTMMAQFFDCVFFTKVAQNGTTARKYLWDVAPTANKMAKDRVSALGVEPIEQNFDVVLKAYASKGILNPKILVIGESGTGKTRALSTIPSLIN